jgi:hypothetical protein
MVEMTREEIQREIDAAQSDLEEIDEMRQAVLRQTGVHVGARVLQEYRTRFDRDQKRLEERLTQLREQLAASE